MSKLDFFLKVTYRDNNMALHYNIKFPDTFISFFTFNFLLGTINLYTKFRITYIQIQIL